MNITAHSNILFAGEMAAILDLEAILDLKKIGQIKFLVVLVKSHKHKYWKSWGKYYNNMYVHSGIPF